MQTFTFIDLFSGIGGFHEAMTELGGKCVFASEIDMAAVKTYEDNYHMNSYADITKVKAKDIPHHDVLCAGFPCQPFSKAGDRRGFEDTTKGTLFFEICRILKYHQPPYIILENVRNLVSHDKGKTWQTIKNALDELGYITPDTPTIISPHQLGVPQLRERVVIIGRHKSLGCKTIDVNVPHSNYNDMTIFNTGILESGKVEDKYYISEHEEKVINCYAEFLKGIKFVPTVKNLKTTSEKQYVKSEFKGTIGFPIWTFEFGNTTDLSDVKYDWKKDFILKNRYLYNFNKSFIDKWLKKWNYLEDFTNTEKKFEWQCGSVCASPWDGLIQFRPSGVRVKAPTVFPSLVAMVQIPIIGSLKRRLTTREAARLQSFPDSFIINENDHQAYKQFGNAVNVKVIKYMAEQLFFYSNEIPSVLKEL